MKPWVSRSDHDHALGALAESQKLVTWLQATITRQQDRLDQMTDQIATMRREGFNLVAPRPQGEDIPQVVRSAILQMAGGQRSRLAYDLREFAAAELAAGRTAEEVATRIIAGDG